jgi:hypothetical protein
VASMIVVGGLLIGVHLLILGRAGAGRYFPAELEAAPRPDACSDRSSVF